MPIKQPNLSFQEKVYQMLEEPLSSNYALAYVVYYDLVVILSIITTMMQLSTTYVTDKDVADAADASVYLMIIDVNYFFNRLILSGPAKIHFLSRQAEVLQ